ncbi:Reduced folate carrier [Parelaphostrongylus tenuis]|uniref:Reduced folate carrier n=1 Tax=Parelaphostrongylus tenuis TaxID=148309 RepID=A0AAD5NBJ3_PARTN|nr:Reduced folate carrier [Parelaphostrongylus tenuis]KAJ1364804.1 Reduced folate carrier [Parelaphostrongylus tenuis]
MHWKATTILLCVYGVTKEFRPATPFLTPYLISDYKNFTLNEVYGMIFPFWTYSYMVFLVPVFFLTDILRYKPVIVLEGACLALTWALLVWGEGITQMRLMQIVFGTASAAEVAYYSYLYAIVNEKNYRRVTSYVRSAALTGKLLAYGLAQVLISTRTATYLTLNQISLAAVVCVFFIAIALPPVPSRCGRRKTLAEHSTTKPLDEQLREEGSTSDGDIRYNPKWGIQDYLVNVFRSFKIFKSNMVVLKWSLWWALASCGIFQLYNYIQSLWIEMQSDQDTIENGLVEVLHTVASASYTVFYPALRALFLSSMWS